MTGRTPNKPNPPPIVPERQDDHAPDLPDFEDLPGRVRITEREPDRDYPPDPPDQ